MKIPQGMTEGEVLNVIENVANRLSRRFKFGYHDIEDMKQQARLFALEGLNSYDNKRPLENFLWTHVRNRLFNLKRKWCGRPEKPCLTCPLYAPDSKLYPSQCQEFDDKEECDLYNGWVNRNATKRNLMNPIGLEGIRDEFEKNMSVDEDVLDKLHQEEVLAILDKNIPMNLRKDYICWKNKIKLPRGRREKIIAIVTSILQEYKIL